MGLRIGINLNHYLRKLKMTNNADDIIGFSDGESFEDAWNKMRG